MKAAERGIERLRIGRLLLDAQHLRLDVRQMLARFDDEVAEQFGILRHLAERGALRFRRLLRNGRLLERLLHALDGRLYVARRPVPILGRRPLGEPDR